MIALAPMPSWCRHITAQRRVVSLQCCVCSKAVLMQAGIPRFLHILLLSTALFTGSAVPATPVPLDPAIEAFIDELAAGHDFDRRQLRAWFSQMRVQNGILRVMAKPSTALPWREFRASHVTEARIRGGVEYWDRHALTLARAASEYGLPEELIVATIGIESFYGRIAGNSKVFDALATLAFNYPPRAELFRGELLQFMLLTREMRLDPLQVRGSYAGALGLPQFLPSSYRRYAVDFDGDGRRDLWSHQDAIGSVANYYKTYGWRPGEPVLAPVDQQNEASSDDLKALVARGINPTMTVGEIKVAGASPSSPVPDEMLAAVFTAETDAGPRYWLGFNNFYVITRYNRSVNYALAVYELAQELRQSRERANPR